MRSVIQIRTAALLALALGATPATAQPESEAFLPGWYVAPMFSLFQPDGQRCGMDDGFGGALAFGNRGEFASLELWAQTHEASYNCDYTVTDPDDPDNRIPVNERGDLTLTGAGLGVVLGPFFDQEILARFFGVVGFGVNQRQNHPQFTQDDTTIFGDIGLGYMHPFDWKLWGFRPTVRGEIRYRYDVQQPPVPDDPDPPPADAYEDVFIQVGLLVPMFRGDDPEPELESVTVVDPVPDPDSFGDGVPDFLDQCPGTPPGTFVDASGCPPPPLSVPDPVSIETAQAGDTIVLSGITFEFASDQLTPNARTVLNGVADQLLKRTAMRVEVGGHTDNLGADAYNQRLSEQRAASVRAYLESRGVPAANLGSVGYGEARPIADNDTEDGREQNRRVELKVIE